MAGEDKTPGSRPRRGARIEPAFVPRVLAFYGICLLFVLAVYLVNYS